MTNSPSIFATISVSPQQGESTARLVMPPLISFAPKESGPSQNGSMIIFSSASLVNILWRTTSCDNAGTQLSCRTEAAASQVAVFGTKGRACLTTLQQSSMKMRFTPSWTTPSSPAVHLLIPSSPIRTLTLIRFLISLASPGSHQKPSRFHQLCHTWVLIRTCLIAW